MKAIALVLIGDGSALLMAAPFVPPGGTLTQTYIGNLQPNQVTQIVNIAAQSVGPVAT